MRLRRSAGWVVAGVVGCVLGWHLYQDHRAIHAIIANENVLIAWARQTQEKLNAAPR